MPSLRLLRMRTILLSKHTRVICFSVTDPFESRNPSISRRRKETETQQLSQLPLAVLGNIQNTDVHCNNSTAISNSINLTPRRTTPTARAVLIPRIRRSRNTRVKAHASNKPSARPSKISGKLDCLSALKGCMTEENWNTDLEGKTLFLRLRFGR